MMHYMQNHYHIVTQSKTMTQTVWALFYDNMQMRFLFSRAYYTNESKHWKEIARTDGIFIKRINNIFIVAFWCILLQELAHSSMWLNKLIYDDSWILKRYLKLLSVYPANDSDCPANNSNLLSLSKRNFFFFFLPYRCCRCCCCFCCCGRCCC